MDGKLTYASSVSTECWWGLRQPVQWANFEPFQSTVSIVSDIYSQAYASSSFGMLLNDSEGVAIFGLTLKPFLLFWDVAFLENMFYVWPPSPMYDRDGWEMCSW